MTVLVEPAKSANGAREAARELTFSEQLACVYCGLSFEELAPRLFSFNSPYGACPDCTGLGVKIEIDPWKVIPDRSKSIEDGAIVPWSKALGGGRFPSMNPYYLQQVEALLRSRRVKMSTPIEKMPADLRRDDALRHRSRSGSSPTNRAAGTRGTTRRPSKA